MGCVSGVHRERAMGSEWQRTWQLSSSCLFVSPTKGPLSRCSSGSVLFRWCLRGSTPPLVTQIVSEDVAALELLSLDPSR